MKINDIIKFLRTYHFDYFPFIGHANLADTIS